MGRPSWWGDRARRRGPIGLILWDHTSRFQGTTHGASTRAMVPRWSLVLRVKAALWDHHGPTLYPGRGPTRGARTTTTWDHPWSQPPHTTAPSLRAGPRVGARRPGSRPTGEQGDDEATAGASIASEEPDPFGDDLLVGTVAPDH